MIELCENCEYSILIADVIGTLMAMEKDGKHSWLKYGIRAENCL